MTGKQRRHLRSLGHHLGPSARIGQHGLTDAVAAHVDRELESHELIKVRIQAENATQTRELGSELAERTQSALIQVLGRVALLYRAREKDPEIRLPR